MKDWFRERFHGLYWRQMAVTVGMVFLTLVLLGVSFFSLSYSYARGQKTDELMVRAMAVSKLSVRYLETGRYLSMEELQKDEQFRQLAATAAVISEMDILVCDMDGHVLLSTDATMDGRPVTIPSSVMDKVSADGTWAGRSRLDQIYSSKQFVGGVSVVNPTTGEVLGAVFTVCASDSVDNLWRAFAGLLMMTGFVVLMISFMASSITTMRQIKPIREMAAATRQYADGDFDVRMLFQSTRPVRARQQKYTKLFYTLLRQKAIFRQFHAKRRLLKRFSTYKYRNTFLICSANRMGKICTLPLRTTRSLDLPEGMSACSQSARFCFRTFFPSSKTADYPAPDP